MRLVFIRKQDGLVLRLLVSVFFHVVDSQLNGTKLFLVGVRDFDTEGILEGQRQFNGRQAVSTEVINEGGFVAHVGFFNAQLFSNNLLNFLFDFVHFSLLRKGVNPRLVRGKVVEGNVP